MSGSAVRSHCADGGRHSCRIDDMRQKAVQTRETSMAARSESSRGWKIAPVRHLVRAKSTNAIGPRNASGPRGSRSPLHQAVASTTQQKVKINAKALGRQLRVEVWLQALQTLSILLWNTCVCVAWIWVMNWVVSYGNLFSGVSASNQSDFEFFTGTIVVVHSVYYWIMLLAHTPVLSTFHFVGHPESHRPPFSFCLFKLVRHTWLAYFVSLLLVVSTLVAFRSAPYGIRKYKLEFHVSCLWVHLYNAATTIAVRGIFLRETVVGQKRSQSYRTPTRWRSVVYFCKIYVLTSPKLIAVLFAGMYVQVTDQYQIAGAWDFIGYTLGSLVLKAGVKKLAKAGAVKLKVKDVRSIFVIAGLPTVLIDTQVRVTLQRIQSTSYTLAWTLGMALIEIGTRVGKVHYTKRQIRRKEIARGPVVVAPDPVRRSFLRLPDQTSFEQWKQQILTFQIAESYASMSAEYIAIGCSTSIIFFYWDHPKYALSRQQGSTSSGSSATQLVPWNRTTALVVQIMAEICVDYLACVLETGAGIEFQLIQRHRGFLGLLFMCIATLNILISATLYFNVR